MVIVVFILGLLVSLNGTLVTKAKSVIKLQSDGDICFMLFMHVVPVGGGGERGVCSITESSSS